MAVELSKLECRVASAYNLLEESLFEKMVLVASSYGVLYESLFEELFPCMLQA